MLARLEELLADGWLIMLCPYAQRRVRGRSLPFDLDHSRIFLTAVKPKHKPAYGSGRTLHEAATRLLEQVKK